MKLHHVNIVTQDVAGLKSFYERSLGLEAFPAPPLIEIPGYSVVEDGKVNNPAAFLSAGDRELLQLHLCAIDPTLAMRMGHAVNPIVRGHIAFRCDDIEAAKRRLDQAGIPYSDYGEWAVKGWHQIFFFDPMGNVIEVHQAS